MRDKLILWGATGQAIVLEELLSSYPVSIEMLFENNTSVTSPFSDIPLLYGQDGFDTWIAKIEDITAYHFVVAIGGASGKVRCELSEQLKNRGLKPYSAIHKTSFVSYNAHIGEGAQILANSSVCARVELGNYCIINTSASVDHECVLGQGVHIGPGAKLAGCIHIDDYAFIGTNATLLPRVNIGANAIVGAGAVVTKDVPPNCIVVGNPAKVINVKS